MKGKDRQEVADIVAQSLIKAGIVKPPKLQKIQEYPSGKIITLPEQPMERFANKLFGNNKEPSGKRPMKESGIKKFFGKKKPPSYSQLKFNGFMQTECQKGCYLCDHCEGKIREIIKNAIEKDE